MSDAAARLLVAFSILNVNNVVYMMTGERQVISLAMLVLAVVVVAQKGSYALREPLLAFLAAITSYLVLGALYSLSSGADVASDVSLRYGGTALIVCAVAGYAVAQARAQGMLDFLRFVHATLLASVATVWITPLLLPLWNFLPLAFESRLSGVFANPNEAGFVSALALAFTLFLPTRLRLLQLFLVAFTVGGVVLSFSKTAAAVSLVVLALALSRSVRGSARLGAIGLALAGLLLVPNLPSIVRWTAEQTVIPLDRDQRERVDEFGLLLSGQFNEQATTGRTRIWEVGTGRIAEQFPHGSGLDTFLELEGGLINPVTHHWQGVHNVFLLVWGEAGILPFLTLVAFFLFTALRLRSRTMWPLGAAILIITLADYNSNHSALALRYSNVMLGILVALVSLRHSRQSRVEPAIHLPHE